MALDTDTLVPVDGAAILANARAVAPILREEASENERRRKLTPRAVDALRSTGVFRMAMPRAWGGPEVDLCTQAAILEELSRADGSAGWCAMIGSDGGYMVGRLDDTAARALFPDLDTVLAGAVAPAGQLHRADGGYRLQGEWSFASGCTHADAIFAGALVHEGGKLVTATDGQPSIRIAVLPADRVEVRDTWNSTGLAGTGSHDFAVADELVPEECVCRFDEVRRSETLYSWPPALIAKMPGVPLGIAQATLDTTEALLADKVVVPELRPARDEPRIRVAVTRAHALVGSARSYTYDLLDEAWTTLGRGTQLSRRQRAAMAGMYGHTAQTCLDAVEILADALGSISVRRECPVERHRRDLLTLCQHVTVQDRFGELAGTLWLDANQGQDHMFMQLGVL